MLLLLQSFILLDSRGSEELLHGLVKNVVRLTGARIPVMHAFRRPSWQMPVRAGAARTQPLKNMRQVWYTDAMGTTLVNFLTRRRGEIGLLLLCLFLFFWQLGSA